MTTTKLTDEELAAKCRERAIRKEEVSKQEAAIEKLNTEIGTEMALRGLTRVDVAEFSVLQIEGERKSIDPKKLVELGVPVDTVTAATVVSTYRQLRVNRRAV